MNKICKAHTKAGSPCQAPAIVGSDYCFFHADPSRASSLGRRGGFGNRRSPIHLEVPDKMDAAALRDLEVQALRAIASGEMNHKVASALFAGCNSLLRLLPFIDAAELGQKISELERRVAQYQTQARTVPCSSSLDSESHRESKDTNSAGTAGAEVPSLTSELRSPQSSVPNEGVTCEEDASGTDAGNLQPDTDGLEQAYDQEEDDGECEN